MLHRLFTLLFPDKCVLCKTFLSKDETDLCRHCRIHAPEFGKSNLKFSFVAGWTGLWYYKDTARGSILRYKFYGRRNYASAYGRLLAMHLQKQEFDRYDLITWVPISPIRLFFRGYDQVALLAKAVTRELGIPSVKTLRKIRHTPPQSSIADVSRRRANVLGAYKVVSLEHIHGKRILLLDDVITTGATISECARVLRTAGVKEVFCAAIAVTDHKTKKM